MPPGRQVGYREGGDSGLEVDCISTEPQRLWTFARERKGLYTLHRDLRSTQPGWIVVGDNRIGLGLRGRLTVIQSGSVALAQPAALGRDRAGDDL